MDKSTKNDPHEQLRSIRGDLTRILGMLDGVADAYSDQHQVDTGTYEIRHGGGDVVALLYVELDPAYEPRDDRFRIEHWGLLGPRDYHTGYVPPHTRETSGEPNQPLDFKQAEVQYGNAGAFVAKLREVRGAGTKVTYIRADCREIDF